MRKSYYLLLSKIKYEEEKYQYIDSSCVKFFLFQVDNNTCHEVLKKFTLSFFYHGSTKNMQLISTLQEMG